MLDVIKLSSSLLSQVLFNVSATLQAVVSIGNTEDLVPSKAVLILTSWRLCHHAAEENLV